MQRQTNDDDKTKILSIAGGDIDFWVCSEHMLAEEELRREQLRAGRAAAYLQARERIFGDASAETAAADTSGESLRTSRSANSLATDTEQPTAVESTSKSGVYVHFCGIRIILFTGGRSSVSSSTGATMIVRTADNQPITVQRASAAVRAQLPSANPPGRGRVCRAHSVYGTHTCTDAYTRRTHRPDTWLPGTSTPIVVTAVHFFHTSTVRASTARTTATSCRALGVRSATTTGQQRIL
jgi:hypothetical protein